MPFTGYRITSPYGNRKNPFGSGTEFHQGIDLVKAHKAPIQAFVGGTVLYAGTGVAGTGLGGYGVVVFIRDGAGRGHLYAHLDSTSVKSGNIVSKGQTIGYQGATGRVTGSHLHYEIRKSTSPSYGWTSNPKSSTLEPTDYLKSLKPAASKSIAQMAKEVADGKHGNGHDNRRKSLGISASDYEKVRAEVNRILDERSGITNITKKSVKQMAQEIIANKHGNGHENRRKSLGISAAEYAKVRAEVNRLSTAKPSKTIAQMAQEVIAGKHGQGHANRQKSLGVDSATYAKVRAEVNKRA